MKQMNELYNELRDVKNTIDWMDEHDTPDNYREVDEARYRVVGTMAGIVDDLLDVTDYQSSFIPTDALNSRGLSTLLKILNDYLNGGSRVSVEDTKQLITIIEIAWYTKRIEDFKLFVENSMPSEDDDQEAWDNFYNMEWNISFGNRSVKITNGAAIYNGILDALSEELA
jgi:hypothetical protein